MLLSGPKVFADGFSLQMKPHFSFVTFRSFSFSSPLDGLLSILV